VLHRDVKALNIFLSGERAKIGDLGVARTMNTEQFARTVVGTPFYLSPELCEERPYNEKSDIWALGCLLYELCTFRRPFEAANPASLILRIIRGK
jgi:NIMA (never in mitosis gene a)-related kinase